MNGNGADAFLIEGDKGINEGTGDDGTFGLDCTFKGSAFELQRMISLSASGSFGKDEEVSSLFHFLRHCLNDLHRLSDVLSVHDEGTQGLADLFEQDDVGRFLFNDEGKGARAGFKENQNIKQTLMIGEHDESVLLGQVFQAMGFYFHPSGTVRQNRRPFDPAEAFLIADIFPGGAFTNMVKVVKGLVKEPEYH